MLFNIRHLLLVIFFMIAGAPYVSGQVLCSEVLKPAASSTTNASSSSARAALDAKAENTVIVDADRLIQKLTDLMQDQSGQRMDFEIADTVLAEVSPLLEKNSSFIKQRTTTQAEAAENNFAARIRSNAKKIEKDLLKISQLITQNKTLKKTIYGLIPGLSRRQIEKWSEKVRTLSGETQYLAEQLRAESKKFVAMEHSLAAEEAQLTQSLEALKKVREILQSDAWPETQDIKIKQNQNIALLQLDMQINNLASIITVTSAFRQQINISLNWNMEAINHSLQIANNTKMVGYVSKEKIDLTPKPYVPPVTKTATEVAANKNDTGTKNKDNAKTDDMMKKSDDEAESLRLQDKNKTSSIIRLATRPLKFLDWQFEKIFKSNEAAAAYARNNPHTVPFEAWLSRIHNLQKQRAPPVHFLIKSYLEKNGKFLTDEQISTLIGEHSKDENGNIFRTSYDHLALSIVKSGMSPKRAWGFNVKLLDRLMEETQERKYHGNHEDSHGLLLLLLKSYQHPLTSQLSLAENKEFLALLTKVINSSALNDQQIYEFTSLFLNATKDQDQLNNFNIADLHEAYKNKISPEPLRKILKKTLLEPVLINSAYALNQLTSISLEDRLYAYQHIESPAFRDYITHPELQHQINHELDIEELKKIHPLRDTKTNIKAWNSFLSAHLFYNAKNISYEKFSALVSLFVKDVTDGKIYRPSFEDRYRALLIEKIEAQDINGAKNFLKDVPHYISHSNGNPFVGNIVRALSANKWPARDIIEFGMLLRAANADATTVDRLLFFREYYIHHYPHLNTADKEQIMNKYLDYYKLIERPVFLPDRAGLEKAAQDYHARLQIQNGNL